MAALLTDPVHIVDIRARWRAGRLAAAMAGAMSLVALLRPLEPGSHRYLRLAVTLVLGLGVAGAALLASLRGRGRAEQVALYWFLALSLDGLGQILGPLGWPRWPLPALLVASLAVAESPPLALSAAGLFAVFASVDAARSRFADWRPALAAIVGYAALALAVQLALLGEKRRLRNAIREAERLRYGLDSGEPEGPPGGLETIRGQLRRISEQGRRDLHAERAAELGAFQKRLVQLARASLKAHAVLLLEIDREAELARAKAWDGPPALDPAAAVPLSQDPVGFVMERRVPFYATDFKRLLWELPYYREATRIGTLLAVPVLVGGAVAAILVADRLEVQALTGEEPELLEGFAALAAESIQQSRAALGREEFGAEFRALYAVSEKLSAAFEAAAVRRLLLETARHLCDFEAAAFAMLDEEKTRYALVEAIGWAEPFQGREVALMERTWTAWVLRGHEEALLVEDLAGQRDQMPVLVLDEGGSRAEVLLAIPLKVGRDEAGEAGGDTALRSDPAEVARGTAVLGAFVLTGRRGAFPAPARRLLGLLGNQAAATLVGIQLREAERSRAVRDGLTRLFNRRAFDEQLGVALSQADRGSGRFALLLADLDHFKRLNDTYGHPAGDAALRAVARVLRRHTRGADVAARYGGEEFAVILFNAAEPGAQQLAERIRRAIEKEKLVFEGARLEVTASFGVAEWPRHGAGSAELLAAADRALYAAKQRGRNRVVAASSLEPAAEPGG